ncbi:hypothetical protein B9Z19DRAFT_1171200 [Tuber borchii]|uniref:Uncharacterized protein n=1 Tax=Tuber borchii TaxID=42251 RepID=A0A2T6ZYM1_TUBBO|nr:hypothetical protein B9Z19DRAFT_1171200 [Tuber borchii]
MTEPPVLCSFEYTGIRLPQCTTSPPAYTASLAAAPNSQSSKGGPYTWGRRKIQLWSEKSLDIPRTLANSMPLIIFKGLIGSKALLFVIPFDFKLLLAHFSNALSHVPDFCDPSNLVFAEWMIVDDFQLGAEVRRCDGSMNIVLQYWQVTAKIPSYLVFVDKELWFLPPYYDLMFGGALKVL